MSAEASLAAGLSAEISRATSKEATLSSQIVDIISNIDVTSIDSFSEVVTELNDIKDDFANIYNKRNTVSGTPNGTLTQFGFGTPVRLNSEQVYMNGLLQTPGDDYTATIANGMVTGIEFIVAPLVDFSIKAYGVY